MIVIAGEVDFPVESRDAALGGAKALIDMALAEQGCRHYAWTADPHIPGRVHVFEEWESAEDLQAHLEGAAYRGMLAHLGGHTILNAETRKYRCDLAEPVYGPDGVASATFITTRKAEKWASSAAKPESLWVPAAREIWGRQSPRR